MSEKYYTVTYSHPSAGNFVLSMSCLVCPNQTPGARFCVRFLDVNPTARGHRWPAMSHKIKHHLRDAHGINLYKRQKPVQP